MFALLIISVSSKEIDKAFVYKVPKDLEEVLKVGHCVNVSFGRGNNVVQAFVVGFCEEAPENVNVKEIISLNDELLFFNDELLNLAYFMQDKYFTTLIDCLKCIMPSGMQFKNDTILSVCDEFLTGKETPNQKKLIELVQSGFVLKSEIENEINFNVDTCLKSLLKKNIIKSENISSYKNLTLKIKFAYINDDYFEDVSDVEKAIGDISKRSPKAASVLRFLMENESLSVSDIKKILHISNAPIETLINSGYIKTEYVETLRNSVFSNEELNFIKPTLSEEQENAVRFIESKKDNKPLLIHGVTGSGKTEIYMRVIEEAINKGKQAIMLVPEISLTAQTVNTFLKRFGDLVTVTHSRLTTSERFDQWKKAKEGKTSIMIGPRSAVFAPFSNLGVIIIDEEHEKTYKSETKPKYCAKEIAIKRGQLSDALVILGSATPALETYYKALNNEYDLVKLKQRINKTMPVVNIVDMRDELIKGNMSVFSQNLRDSILLNLEKKEQTILFLNRRGFSTFVSCRKCGYVLECESCNVNYTFHLATEKLICHYCGKKIRNPKNCPQCGSKYIKYFGTGTQKIEEEVKKMFPEARTLRMDMDTTQGKHSHDILLSKFRNKEADILIGTQMIAKGLDFPSVSLVGIIAADISLNNGDFRAAETTFQLLTQVAGRAGRALTEGKVYIQTYNPEHYSIIFAKDNDYENFYEHELSLRRQMQYPPFTHVFSIMITSSDEKKTIMTLFKLLEIMKYYNKKELFEMVGPAPCTISKIKKKYRWKLIIKSVDEEKLKNFSLYCLDRLKEKENVSDLTFHLTLNPNLIL